MTRLDLLPAALEILNDLACALGWHAWYGGADDERATRYCATCGRTERLREWSVSVSGARWERTA